MQHTDGIEIKVNSNCVRNYCILTAYLLPLPTVPGR